MRTRGDTVKVEIWQILNAAVTVMEQKLKLKETEEKKFERCVVDVSPLVTTIMFCVRNCHVSVACLRDPDAAWF